MRFHSADGLAKRPDAAYPGNSAFATRWLNQMIWFRFQGWGL